MRSVLQRRLREEGDDGMGDWSGPKGDSGMPGPTSRTFFETTGGWSEKYVELDNLCLKIQTFLQHNPDIASRVEITKDAMISKL